MDGTKKCSLTSILCNGFLNLKLGLIESPKHFSFKFKKPPDFYLCLIFNPWKVSWNWKAFSQNYFVISSGLFYHLTRRNNGRIANKALTSNPIVSSKQLLDGLKITNRSEIMDKWSDPCLKNFCKVRTYNICLSKTIVVPNFNQLVFLKQKFDHLAGFCQWHNNILWSHSVIISKTVNFKSLGA